MVVDDRSGIVAVLSWAHSTSRSPVRAAVVHEPDQPASSCWGSQPRQVPIYAAGPSWSAAKGKRWTAAGRIGHHALAETAGRSASYLVWGDGEVSSSLPYGLPRASGLLPTRRWSPRRAPYGRAGSRRARCGAVLFSPAVPPACHKQRSPAVSSGRSRSLEGGRGTGRRSLTCGGGGVRNCMACKGSGVQRTFDSGPQSQGTGTPKVAPGPVANTVLRSEAPARAPDEELSQGQSNGVMPICVRAARRLRAHTPWRPP
jgi:hypothetical protein